MENPNNHPNYNPPTPPLPPAPPITMNPYISGIANELKEDKSLNDLSPEQRRKNKNRRLVLIGIIILTAYFIFFK